MLNSSRENVDVKEFPKGSDAERLLNILTEISDKSDAFGISTQHNCISLLKIHRGFMYDVACFKSDQDGNIKEFLCEM